MHFKYFIILFVILGHAFGQSHELTTQNSYDEIYQVIRTYDQDNVKAFSVINILIQKAKEEKDYWYLYKAYRTSAAYAAKDLELVYADSCVWAAEQSNDSIILGNAYLTRGLNFNGRREYDKALSDYLIAEKYLYKSDDGYAKNKLLFSIGQIKNYLGMTDEAILMIDSANHYFSKLETKNDSSFYLYSLNSLKKIQVNLGNYDKATQMYHQGKAVNTVFKNDLIESLLDLYEGFNQYKKEIMTMQLN